MTKPSFWFFAPSVVVFFGAAVPTRSSSSILDDWSFLKDNGARIILIGLAIDTEVVMAASANNALVTTTDLDIDADMIAAAGTNSARVIMTDLATNVNISRGVRAD